MNWQGKKVGYWPYHLKFETPGDRRRFVFYATEKKINFEIADPLKKYDIVYLTNGCDIAKWITYKQKHPETKIIFELIDSNLLEDPGVFTFFRGMIRFFTGRESKLFLNYKTALRKIISISDVVVCATPVQKKDMELLNNNIHISLDYFSNDITHHKNSFETTGKFKLVWEGQAYTAKNILLLNDILHAIRQEVELHIITDPVIRYPLHIFNKDTKKLFRKLKCSYHFHNWEKHTFSEIISRCDLAVIPIFKNQSIMWNKPENKLLLLWEIGIPVLAADTPAYIRVMDAAGLDFYCGTGNEWLNKIKRFMNSKTDERKSSAAKANSYLQNFHNKNIILKNWDAIFEPV
jgi:hypothetical protein